MLTFKDPLILVLLVLLPLLFIVYKKFVKKASVKYSDIRILKKVRHSKSKTFRYIPFTLKAFAMALIVIALAGPRQGEELSSIKTEGVDIMLCVDISGSMRAEDFFLGGKRQNRLAIVKQIVKEFIENRVADRIGMVVFAGRAYTQCPLTMDYGVLLTLLSHVQIGMLEDGTGIGSALAIAVDRLKDTKAKSKVIILLTDGINNVGKIDPLTAAEIAKSFKIKVYTIGAGTRGLAPIPVRDYFGNVGYQKVKVDVDEDTLEEIAELTGAKYYRATNTESLRKIYRDIDSLEKTKIETKLYMKYKELFPYFLLPGFLLLILDILLSNTIYRKLP